MIQVSIIIVNYKVKDKLYACIQSIYNSKPKNDFEIIVVNNDEDKIIAKELLKKFPNVKYIKSDKKSCSLRTAFFILNYDQDSPR